MTLMSVQNVTMRFGGVVAVSNVSLEIAEATLLGFIGPNGAGKTTLMRVITGVLRPQSGQVIFQGEDITSWPVDRRVRNGLALAQQLVKPLGSLSLIDNVALAAGASRMSNPLAAFMSRERSEERDKARKLLARVGISNVAESLPKALPLGHLKRLEVARALALNPRLLLLDEPLAGLNQSEARDMADLISDLVAPDRSILLIEHNIREVARICSEIYVQDNGERLLQGPTKEVMASPKLHKAYIGDGVG